MKERNLEALTANMRKAPTFASAEEVIRRDYPLKLPARNWLQLWNTPELSQFRGVVEDNEAHEQRRIAIQQEKHIIHQVAHDAPMPDVEHEARQRQHQQHMEGLLRNLPSQLDALHRQQTRGMQQETLAELQRLANAQEAEAKKARMAEEAFNNLSDHVMQDRDRLAARAPEVHNHYHSTTNNTTNLDQTNLHNAVANMLSSHQAQFGAYMHQNRLSSEAMFNLLRAHMQSRVQSQPDDPMLRLYMRSQPDPAPMLAVENAPGPPPPGRRCGPRGGPSRTPVRNRRR